MVNKEIEIEIYMYISFFLNVHLHTPTLPLKMARVKFLQISSLMGKFEEKNVCSEGTPLPPFHPMLLTSNKLAGGFYHIFVKFVGVIFVIFLK